MWKTAASAVFLLSAAEKNIRAQFGDDAFGRLPAGNQTAMALGGLLDYLYETQKTDLSYLHELDYYEQGLFMELDLAARRNLELTGSSPGQGEAGQPALGAGQDPNPMGGRILRSWLERPLLTVTAISRRSAAVAALVDGTIARRS